VTAYDALGVARTARTQIANSVGARNFVLLDHVWATVIEAIVLIVHSSSLGPRLIRFPLADEGAVLRRAIPALSSEVVDAA